MNLTLFFRLILMSIFQHNNRLLKPGSRIAVGDRELLLHCPRVVVGYREILFHCPRVFAKDGFNISLQIHNGNYCESENGRRKFGHTFNRVEWGFPSIHEELLRPSSDGDAEKTNDLTNSVGSIETSLMEEILEKHGGIDWEATLSIEMFKLFTQQ